MEYFARFSIIKEGYGLMGIQDESFYADTLEELKEAIDEFYYDNETKSITYLLDELEDEEGNALNIRAFL